MFISQCRLASSVPQSDESPVSEIETGLKLIHSPSIHVIIVAAYLVPDQWHTLTSQLFPGYGPQPFSTVIEGEMQPNYEQMHSSMTLCFWGCVSVGQMQQGIA